MADLQMKLEDTLAVISEEAATQLIRSAAENMQRAENRAFCFAHCFAIFHS